MVERTHASVIASIRRWSGDDRSAIAAVELLVKFDLLGPAEPWVKLGHYDSMWVEYWVDANELERASVTGRKFATTMQLAAVLLRDSHVYDAPQRG